MDAPPTSEEQVEDVAIAVSGALPGSGPVAEADTAPRERIRVKPVFLVPTDVEPPGEEQVRLLTEHLAWARRRYLELLDGQDTFELAPGPPLVLSGEHEAIAVHGTTWCPDCKRAKQFLGDRRAHYHWVDIE